jgi:superfamily II DNA or RNA helicase
MKEVKKLDNGKLAVKFFYPSDEREKFNLTLAAVKSLPVRSWRANLGYWEVDICPKSILILKEAGFDVPSDFTKDIEKLIAEEEEIQKEKARQIAAIRLKDTILYKWQRQHARTLIVSLIENNAALDGSDTGTGKTFASLEAVKYFDLIPIVLTKKRAISQWERVIKIFGFKEYYINNYEQYKFFHTPYLTQELKVVAKKKKDDPDEFQFLWRTDKRHIIIFDEAHCCKNRKTVNAQMLQTAKTTGSRIMALSATIGDNPLQLYSLGIALEIFSDEKSYWRWAYGRGVVKKYMGVEFLNTEENLFKIHKDLFPKRGSRMAIAELPEGAFPENKIIADLLDMGKDAEKIQKVYDEMSAQINNLKESMKNDSTSIFTAILRARQEIELLKVPTIVDLAKDLVEEGASVAIFVNFKETLAALKDKLKTNCIIDGSTKYEQCIKNKDDFLADREHIIICNIKSGGVAIDLNDQHGVRRRESIISPTNSAQDLIQTLGRIFRAGTKTHCIQRIIFAKGTAEEDVAENVSRKIDNMKKINDGELATKFELLAFIKKESEDEKIKSC